MRNVGDPAFEKVQGPELPMSEKMGLLMIEVN